MENVSLNTKVNESYTSTVNTTKSYNSSDSSIMKTSSTASGDRVEKDSSEKCFTEIDGKFNKAKGEIKDKDFSIELKTGLLWGLGNIKGIDLDMDGEKTSLDVKKKSLFGGKLAITSDKDSDKDVDLIVKNKTNNVDISGTFDSHNIDLSFDEEGSVTGKIDDKDVSIDIDNELGKNFGSINTTGDFNDCDEFMPVLSMLYHIKKMDDWNPEAWG